jgi:CHAT domain-containing protein
VGREGRNPDIEKVEAEIRAKKRELHNYINSLKKSYPDLATLLGAKPIELKYAQEKLSPETPLIQYLILPDKLVIFIIKATTIDIQEEPLRKELKVKVEQYQKHLKSIERSKELTKDTSKELHQIYSDLYDILIKPVKGKLQGITTLGISPNGYLHYVPFGALWSKEGGETKYLIDQYKAIFYVNSTSIFWIATDRAGKSNVSESNLVAYINPDESLKFAEEEKKQLQGIFRHNKIYYGGDAKKEELETMALSNAVLHFSTHGSLNSRDSSRSYLVMANNRNLMVQDIWGLPLKGNVVTTLSACETALGQPLSGDDIVSLENAFIYAGSPSIISTLWKVDEKPTLAITTAFYRNLVDKDKKMSKAEALTQAQRDLKKNYPSYADPFFWAGFMLRGTYQ